MKRSPVEGNLGIDSDVGVILPTYCEVANIERIVQEIENLNLNTTILVIDDSSPDRTADTVRALQKRYENVLLLVRPRKSGLGTAITDGFRVFLSLQNPPKCIVTMDADCSHNPKEIPRLIAPMHDAYDLIVGSRYYRGGSTQDWGIVRLAISKIANLITKYRIAAGIHDYTSGMRCYSTRVVRSMINDLHSQTYEIQIETIRQANLRRFKLKEVPITFVNRKKGKSKLSLNEIRDFLSYIMSIGRRC